MVMSSCGFDDNDYISDLQSELSFNLFGYYVHFNRDTLSVLNPSSLCAFQLYSSLPKKKKLLSVSFFRTFFAVQFIDLRTVV